MNALRPQFDPEGEFVVAKSLIVTNTKFEPDPSVVFDKGLVSTRLLRQLYEQRYLEVADPDLAEKSPSRKGRVRRTRFTDGGSP